MAAIRRLALAPLLLPPQFRLLVTAGALALLFHFGADSLGVGNDTVPVRRARGDLFQGELNLVTDFLSRVPEPALRRIGACILQPFTQSVQGCRQFFASLVSLTLAWTALLRAARANAFQFAD